MGAKKVQMIDLDKLDFSAQTRSEIRSHAVREYALMVERGKSLDPALVIISGERYIVAAGNHRAAAYRLAGKTAMPCIVESGTLWDAVKAGINDNHQHVGERVTIADKRQATKMVLELRPEMSDRAIAALCRVSHPFVSKLRREVSSGGNVSTLASSDSPICEQLTEPASGGDPVIPDTFVKEPPVVASVPQESADVAESRPKVDLDQCECGNSWMSDGAGGRFCPDCGLNHPRTPSVPFEAGADEPQVKPVSADIVPSSESQKHGLQLFVKLESALECCRRDFDALHKAAPDVQRYKRSIGAINDAAKEVTEWKASLA